MEKLTAKEKRLFDYIASGGSGNIGDACRALKTTPFTLLGKTLPGLREKGMLERAQELRRASSESH